MTETRTSFSEVDVMWDLLSEEKYIRGCVRYVRHHLFPVLSTTLG